MLDYLPFTLLTKGVSPSVSQSHKCCWILRDHLVFSQCLVCLSQISKVGVFQCLRARHSIRLIVVQQFRDNFLDFGTYVWYQLFNSSPFFHRKVEFHVTSYLLKLLQKRIIWCSEYVVYFMNLIKFVVAREQRKQRQHFEKYTTHSPVVHFVIIISICKQTLGRSIPTSGYVFGERRLRVYSSTRSEVGKFDLIIFNEDVFTKRKTTYSLNFTYGFMSR